MDKKELKALLVKEGWTEDRFGHVKKEFNAPAHRDGKLTYRVKFQDLSVRLERLCPASEGGLDKATWFKRDGAYFKDIVVRDGKLVIGKTALKLKPTE